MKYFQLHTDHVFVVEGSTFTVRYLEGDKVEVYLFGEVKATYYRSDFPVEVYPMRFVEQYLNDNKK
jgi:hypothetical protein